MNLIEKYGSYDAAKAKQQELSKIAADPQLLLVGKIIREIGGIEIALLEYRRQHNIFEVGDAVIRKWNGRLYYLIVDIDNDGQEFLIHHDKGAKFKDCRIFDNICNFKHATDEEIKAGKRLEVNQ